MKIAIAIFISLLIGYNFLLSNPKSTGVVIGQVTSADSSLPLRLATVRVLGTKRGALTDKRGVFALRLPFGDYTLEIGMVGYKKKEITVKAGEDTIYVEAKLETSEARTADVIVSGEDPARALMRAVLEKKERQKNAIQTYKYLLYTKLTAITDTGTSKRSDSRSDSTIFSIFESYSEGYYRAPSDFFNRIIQRRQTANIPPQANMLAIGSNLNAYEDVVSLFGEEIITPFHPNALDYYTFAIEKTYRDKKQLLVQVKATPKSSRKMMSGILIIEPDSAVPVSVDLFPSSSTIIPFDGKMHFQQRFLQSEEGYVIPSGLGLDVGFQVALLFLINPRLDVNIETVAYDYQFNIPLDNDLFEQRRVEVSPMADKIDSIYWKSEAAMPLKIEELTAYKAIEAAQETADSVAAEGLFNQIFAPITRVMQTLARPPFTGFDDIYRYNRIHGNYLGFGFRDTIKAWEPTVKSGYGFADKRWYAEAGLRYSFDEVRKYSIGASGYRRLARRDNPFVFSSSGITFLSLLAKNDYGDYYYADGGELFLEAGWGQLRFVRQNLFVRPTTMKLFLKNEFHSPAIVNTEYSIFGSNKNWRDNPAAISGILRSIGGEFNWNYHPLRRLSKFGFRIVGEYSSPDLLQSAFNFQQISGNLFARFKTLPLWRMDLFVSGGWNGGDVPPQRFFSFETSAASLALSGVIRGMGVKEYYGDAFGAISFEHNFGEVIPGILRIPNIASFGLELIATGSAAWSGFSNRTLQHTKTELNSLDRTRNGWYGEIGMGINKLLLFFRVDVSARFTQRINPQFLFTISAATF